MTAAAAAGAPRFIAPGATLGVLGGGQLGRMLAMSAQAAGYRVVVVDPDAASPAGAIAHEHLRADYLDRDALAALASRCAAVTTEFENVPAAALQTLARSIVVAPPHGAVAVCQDRALEKAALAACGVPCVPHAVVRSAADLEAAPAALFPAILKTARLGYDGKGQRRVDDRVAAAAAFAELREVTCVLEKRIALRAEASVVVARGRDGAVVHLPVQDNVHEDGILAVTRVPSRLAAAQQSEAVRLATRVAESLDYVGVLCVEFFVDATGALLANEMAPRPHNSGHWSLDGADASQFELQWRSLVGAPLPAPRAHSAALMLNLLGDLWLHGGRVVEPDWAGVLAVPGAHLHLYGKAEPRAGRKMGHLTLTGATPADAEAAARRAAGVLGLAGVLDAAA